MKKILILLFSVLMFNQIFSMEKEEHIHAEQHQQCFYKWSDLPEELKTEILKQYVYDLIKNRKSVNDLTKQIVNLKIINKNIKNALDKLFENKYILELSEEINASSESPISSLHLAQALLKESFVSFKDYLTKVKGRDNFDELGHTLLSHLILGTTSIDQLKKFIRNGANLNVQIGDGYSGLMLAASDGDFNIVKVLINGGADINIQDKNGFTPLIAAARQKHGYIVKALIDAGAKIEIQTKEGKTTYDYACESNNLEIQELLKSAVSY